MNWVAKVCKKVKSYMYIYMYRYIGSESRFSDLKFQKVVGCRFVPSIFEVSFGRIR